MPFKNRHPLYSTWANMIQRCHTLKHTSYGRYGARGIVVCDAWRGDFKQFCHDMGERAPGTTLDRIDNDGNYEPGNCRWASPTEQQRNRSNNKLTKALADQISASVGQLRRGKAAIARKYGISPAMVRKIAGGKPWR